MECGMGESAHSTHICSDCIHGNIDFRAEPCISCLNEPDCCSWETDQNKDIGQNN